MKALLVAAGAAMVLGGCQTMVPADDRMAAAAAPAMSEAAMRYMQMAHSGNMFEVESSRLALQMSQNPAVQTFAQMMIDDHTRLMNEMMSMTGGQMPDMAMQMAPHHMDMLQRLRSTPAAGFDMAYHREQVMAHQESVNLHSSYAATGDNPVLRDLAARATPVVQMHLERLNMHGFHSPQSMQPMQPMPMQDRPRRAGERG